MLKINVIFCSDTANTLACKYICSFTFFVFKLLILLSCGKLLFLLLIGNFSMLKKAFFFSLLITRQHVCKLEDMNLLGRKVLYINSSVFFQIFLLGKAKKKKIIALSENISFLFPQHLYVIGIFLSAF